MIFTTEQITMIIAAILGGILSAGAGVVLDVFREKTKLQKTRELLTIAICDDLQHSMPLYEKIMYDWMQHKTIYFTNLNELKESRQTYLNNKDWIHIFEDSRLRRDIFRYYLQSSECINLLEFNQNRKYAILRDYNKLLNDLRLKDPSASEEDIKERAVKMMPEEDREIKDIENITVGSISTLRNMRETAVDLIERLKVY